MVKLLHTLEDKIVEDAIIATTLADRLVQKCMNGGMAIQSYLPRRRGRPTADVDFTFNRATNYQDFKEIMHDTIAALESFGYQVGIQQNNLTYALSVENAAEKLFVQVRRTSPGNYAKNARRNDREYQNAKPHIIGRTTTRVMRAEDIMLRKLVRILAFERDYALTPRLWSGNLRKELSAIETFRKPFFESLQQFGDNKYPPQIQKAIATVRMQADLYDIAAIFEKCPVDELYLQKGAEEYDTLCTNAKKVREIVKHLSHGSQVVDESFFPSLSYQPDAN